MKRKILAFTLIFGAVLLISDPCFAIKERIDNLLIIIDSSASMSTRTVDGMKKIDVAKITVMSLVNKLSKDMNVGLMVYGDYRDNPCDRVQIVHPIAPLDREGIWITANFVKAKGLTPLAESIEKAAELLSKHPGKSSILVITDGKDTCGGDPVAVARQVQIKYKLSIVIDVIGLNVPSFEQLDVKTIARAGGGRFFFCGTQPEMLGISTMIADKRIGRVTNEVGALTVKYSPSLSVNKILIYDQYTGAEVEGSAIWKSFKECYMTKLKPGRYSIKIDGNFNRSPAIIRNVVIKENEENVIDLDELGIRP